MIRCPEISSDENNYPSNVMCRINELMSEWKSTWSIRDIILSVRNLTYVDLPAVNTADECSLQCMQYANSMRLTGCCEFRIAEKGNCTWTSAKGHPYLAPEYRYTSYSEDNQWSSFGTSKNTRAVLCSPGKIIQ